MVDLDSWQEIFATLRKNTLRTFLTGLGVFLGILILMIMIGFGKSLESGVKRSMAGFATNAVFVWGQKTSLPYAGLPPNRPVDAEARANGRPRIACPSGSSRSRTRVTQSSAFLSNGGGEELYSGLTSRTP